MKFQVFYEVKIGNNGTCNNKQKEENVVVNVLENIFIIGTKKISDTDKNGDSKDSSCEIIAKKFRVFILKCSDNKWANPGYWTSNSRKKDTYFSFFFEHLGKSCLAFFFKYSREPSFFVNPIKNSASIFMSDVVARIVSNYSSSVENRNKNKDIKNSHPCENAS